MDPYDDPLLNKARNMIVNLTERLARAEAERDTALAENEKLREALAEAWKYIRDDILEAWRAAELLGEPNTPAPPGHEAE